MRKLFILSVIAALSISAAALAGEPIIPPEIVGMKIIGAMGVYYNGSTSALLLSGNYLYCAMSFNGGLKTVNVSDPTNMVLTSEWDPMLGDGGQAYGLAMKGSVLYLTNFYYGTGLRVFSIADPAHPLLVRTLSTTTIAWHPCAEGNLLFIAVSDGGNHVRGVDIFDITNPSSPTWRSFVSSDNEQVGRPAAYGNYMYMFSGCWLSVYNVSNPSSPIFVRQIYSNTGVGDLEIKDGYLYMRGGNGLYIYSLADPSNPQQVGSIGQVIGYDWPHGTDVHLQERYCIAPAMGSGVYAFDINDPLNVTQLWQIAPTWPGTGHGGYSECAAGAGDYVFIGTGQAGGCTQCGGRVYALHIQDTTPPGPVTSFAAAAGEGCVTLSWTNPSDSDFGGTVIRFSTTGYPATRTDGLPLAYKPNSPGSSDSYVHRYLTYGLTYYYAAFARDLSNNYATAVTAHASTLDSIPPGPVTAFGATGGDGKVSLSWINPTTSDFKGTTIRYSTTGYPSSPTDGTLVTDRANSRGTYDSYVHNGLTNGVRYYYSAFTYDLVPNFSSAVDGSTSPVGRTGITVSSSTFDSDADGWNAATWRAGTFEFGTMTRHGSAGNPEGCMRCTGGGSADNTDRCRREGGQISKVISTAGYKNIRVTCDLRVNSLGAQYIGAGSGSCTVDHDLIDEQLTVFYSTDGGSNWTEAEWSKRSDLLAGYQSYGTRTIDLSGISGVSNNPSFALRFRWQLNTAGDIADLDNIVVSGEVPDVCIATAKQLPEGSEVLLVNKVLYLKQGSFGYIEEPDRSSGVRVEGSIAASVGNLVCVSGAMQTTAGGERYILLTGVSANGTTTLKPLGMSNRALADSLAKGLCVTTWGRVKSGSVTADSYVVTDGSDEAGIKVATPGSPGVSEGQYVTVTGAAGFDGLTVVVYTQ